MRIIIAAIGATLAFYVIYLFNKLVKQKNYVKEAWSGIDVQLKRRYSLIPNLVETVKAYTKYEGTVLEEITKVRQRCIDASNVKEQSEAEVMLTNGFKQFFALAEDYPDLKANAQFINLQKNLIETEDAIQYARRYYNGTVRDFNIITESFPSNLIALIFGYKSKDYFEVTSTTERENVRADVKEEK
ncbi:MAG: LemA family protein [bacterium]|nr:LemA family protein [bacterium]